MGQQFEQHLSKVRPAGVASLASDLSMALRRIERGPLFMSDAENSFSAVIPTLLVRSIGSAGARMWSRRGSTGAYLSHTSCKPDVARDKNDK